MSRGGYQSQKAILELLNIDLKVNLPRNYDMSETLKSFAL